MNGNTLKKNKIDMVDFIDNHNSLLLRNKDGRILYFDDIRDMYLKFLKRLRIEFANGYIEPAHYVIEHYQLNSGEAATWLQYSYRHFRLENVIILNWKELSSDDKHSLKVFVQSLHNLLGTPFYLDKLNEILDEYE